jgi:acyl-CoA thioesterase I
MNQRINFYSIRPFLLIFLLALVFLSCQENKSIATSKEETMMNTEEETEERKIILFYGNSLTAGYGIEAEAAFPGLIAKTIDSLGYNYQVINGGLSGETTAGGLRRLDWFLEETPSIFVLELGGNDGLRGLPAEETKKNLKEIISKVRAKSPKTKIILAGMQIPPNMGSGYAQNFVKIYPEIAKEENVTLIPFLLEGVAGNRDLNLKDGIHPTEEGHLIIYKTIWPFIKEAIEKN